MKDLKQNTSKIYSKKVQTVKKNTTIIATMSKRVDRKVLVGENLCRLLIAMGNFVWQRGKNMNSSAGRRGKDVGVDGAALWCTRLIRRIFWMIFKAFYECSTKGKYKKLSNRILEEISRGYPEEFVKEIFEKFM